MSLAKWKRFISLAYGVVSAILYVVHIIFIILNRDVLQAEDIAIVELLLSIGTFSFLATLLTYQRPENRISWLIFLIALMRQTAMARITIDILIARGVEPTFWLTWAGIFWPAISGLTYGILAYIMVLFPTGRLPSRRWRAANWLLGLNGVITAGIVLFVTYDMIQFFSGVSSSPTEIALVPVTSSGPFSSALHVRTIPELGYLAFVIGVAIILTLIMAIFSLTNRYRRGSLLVRQQIKWVMLAIAIWALALLLIFLPLNIPFTNLLLVAPLPPIAIALAILRYRLFDIDLIIRRTLVYALLSAVLAGVYFGMVALLQQLFSLISGESSPGVIIISTLALVIMFAPLRRRIQDLIDRRFYRKKYNAEEAMRNFAQATRDVVDLDALSEELLWVIQETVQPEQISIWLKEK